MKNTPTLTEAKRRLVQAETLHKRHVRKFEAFQQEYLKKIETLRENYEALKKEEEQT